MSKATTRQLIIDSALRAIGDASLADVLSFLAPARLAEESRDLITRERRLGERPLTPPTIASHFALQGTARQFDRDALVDDLLDLACARMEDIGRSAARGYLSAADALKASGSADPVHDAIADDMANYQPGDNEPADDARLRVYYLAMAMCDVEGSIASKLRATDTILEGTYRGVYEEFLRLTGREVIHGYTVRDVNVLVTMLLNGHEMRCRSGNAIPIEQVSDAIMRIFWAFTVPVGSPTLDIEEALVASLGSDSRSAP